METTTSSNSSGASRATNPTSGTAVVPSQEEDLLNTPQPTPRALNASGDSGMSLKSSPSAGAMVAQAMMNRHH